MARALTMSRFRYTNLIVDCLLHARKVYDRVSLVEEDD